MSVERLRSINYSATIGEESVCALYCRDTEDCAAFSHSPAYSRCALWIDNHFVPWYSWV
eukprot:UN16374